MLRRLITGLLLFLDISVMLGQAGEQRKQEWGLDLSGFVNAQLYFDTRQNVESREGMFTLYPAKAVFDEDGRDINQKVNLNQAAMTTRLRARVNAPDAIGASISGVIEVDFTGVNNLDQNGLRLREGWVQLKWSKTGLLVGQYWHPLNVPEARPMTISLNLGAPYHPFSRHTQVRVQQGIGIVDIIAVAASQNDYASEGPYGRNPAYLINSGVPNLDLQAQLHLNHHMIGAGMDYKQLLPRLYVDQKAGILSKTKEKIHSLAATAFAHLSFEKIIINFQALWGENLTEHVMLGGYIENLVDTANNRITYANTGQFSVWTDMITNGKMFRVGLFAGYAINLGYDSGKAGAFFGRGEDILYTYRISPRLQFHFDKLLLAGEFEFTSAAYGMPDPFGNVLNANTVGNFRILLAAFYFF